MKKHFLDTSVLRPVLTSSPKVKEYYQEKLDGEKYICDYIKMEFLRGYVKSAIAFYFLLAMPQYKNTSEVLHVWSNNFKIREHKNIEILLANLIAARKCTDNKEQTMQALADYIRRLVGKLNYNFKIIGSDNTYCTKSKVRLNFDPASLNESLRDFENTLKDNNQYKNCQIKKFIKTKNKEKIDLLINNAEKVKRF
jgi:hypothetical protein